MLDHPPQKKKQTNYLLLPCSKVGCGRGPYICIYIYIYISYQFLRLIRFDVFNYAISQKSWCNIVLCYPVLAGWYSFFLTFVDPIPTFDSQNILLNMFVICPFHVWWAIFFWTGRLLDGWICGTRHPSHPDPPDSTELWSSVHDGFPEGWADHQLGSCSSRVVPVTSGNMIIW